MSRGYYVYILCGKSGMLCIGSTDDLERCVFEHKQGSKASPGNTE